MNKLKITDLLDVKVNLLNGSTFAKEARRLSKEKKHSVTKFYLEKKIVLMDNIYSSNLPTLQMDKEIVQNTLMEKLEPIREEMASKSIDIIREIDALVQQKLSLGAEEISAKDLAAIMDKYYSRFARLSGIEMDKDPEKAHAPVNKFITNIFTRFLPQDQVENHVREKADVVVVDKEKVEKST